MKYKKKESNLKIVKAKGRPMLHWVGKKPLDYIKSFPAQLVEVFDPVGKTRRIENPSFEELKDNWQNLLFHGDNKEVLGFLLANGFRGKIDLVYIDPPFDSGANYVRKVELRGIKEKIPLEGEDYSLGEQTQYFDIWGNDNYLQWMYERLLLLKELLSNKGTIYVHLDHRRIAQLRLIMDEIFGEEKFGNIVVWRRQIPRGMKAHASLYPFSADYILVFSKTSGFIWNPQTGTNKISIEEAEKKYMKDEKGYFRTSDPGTSSFESLLKLYEEGRLYASNNGEIIIDRKHRRVYNNKGSIGIKYYREKKRNFVIERYPVDNIWEDIPGMAINPSEYLDYPTQKPEKLLRRIIEASSNPDSIILDCFMGSGTTQRVAQKLGRKWIGIDINKGAIQTSMKELQKVILEQSKDDKKNGKQKSLSGKEEKPCLSFAHYKVNDYDLQLLRTEVIELVVQHIGIQRTKTDTFFDGTLGKNLVKIIDFNHPLTLLDLQLIQDELKKRPDENRNITIVCLDKELTVEPWIEDYNKKHPVNKLEVIELRTDKKYGKFLIHKPTQAKVSIKRKGEKAQIEIKDFISPSVIERLNDEKKLIKVKIPDFKSMIDVVLIDTEYNGKMFNIKYSDVPEKKKDLVIGKYELEIPKKKTTIAVKIIDMLGEEVLITEEI